MRISDLYKSGNFIISFEIFPPKTAAGEESLKKELQILKTFAPAFVSVTYGAGGSTREKTMDLSIYIKNILGINPLVHFTCVGYGRQEISKYLKTVKDKGLCNILALRGDPPQGTEKFVAPEDGFAYANELVSYIKGTIDGLEIGVAGYPEGHIESASIDADIENLKKKVDAGAEFIISQLFYDNDDFFRYMEKIRGKGINVPVVPGIMPVTNLAQIKKISSMVNKIPAKLVTTLESCSSEDEQIEKGIGYTIEQCKGLKSSGVPGLHLYTLNKSFAVKKILENI